MKKNKNKSSLQRFEEVYKQEIKDKSWITKDDMTEKGFFPKEKSNGKDIRFISGKYEIEVHRVGNRIPKFRVLGLNNKKTTRAINSKIRKELKNERCPILGTHNNTEIDHKNGRYNDPRVLNTKTQRVEDFQVISKVLNNKKREECKKCIETNKKFDARKMSGFQIPTLDGVLEHNGTPNGCEGCILYDFKHFITEYNKISNELKDRDSFPKDEFYKIYKNKNQ